MEYCKHCDSKHIASWEIEPTGQYQGYLTEDEAKQIRELFKVFRLNIMSKHAMNMWVRRGVLRVHLARMLLSEHENNNKIGFDQWRHVAAVMRGD